MKQPPIKSMEDRASKFIGHNTDLRKMCLTLGISIDYVAKNLADFARAELSRQAAEVDSMKYTIVEMTKEEYDALPDFEGF